MNTKLLVVIFGVAASLTAFIVIGRTSGLDAGEWASWVQAVGSIAAILLAYFLGERQTSVALQAVREAERMSSARIYDQILALADSAEKFTEKMSRIFHDGGFSYLDFSMQYDDAITESLLDSLKAVSAHELGSYNAILALATLRKALYDFRRNMAQIDRHLAEQTNPETGQIKNWHEWSAVPIELCVRQIERCVLALRGYRPEFAQRPDGS